MFRLITAYLFFRLHSYYRKWDGADVFRSAGIVALTQSVFVGGFTMLCFKLSSKYFGTPFYSFEHWKHWYLAFIVGMLILNYTSYKGKFEQYVEEWGEEPKPLRRKKKKLLVLYVLVCICPLVFFFFLY